MNNIALLVISCDKYNDLWDKYFMLLNKMWPNCPFPIFLQTNFLDFKACENVNVIKVGFDNSWSDGLKKSLYQLKDYDYVLLMMEDMFLNTTVNNENLKNIISNFFLINGNFLTLINEPQADKKFNDYFGIISPKAMYRATATASLWKKDVLLDILNPLETAWQFEKIGSKRTDKYDGFYSVSTSCFSFFHGVIKGKWTIDAEREFEKLGIKLDYSYREVYSTHNELSNKLYKNFRSIILKIVPFKYRRYLLRK